jgi:hypothetical protein
MPVPTNIADLRIALFSGNYNYVRDGANQALNRLVGYLEQQGLLTAAGFRPAWRSKTRPFGM